MNQKGCFVETGNNVHTWLIDYDWFYSLKTLAHFRSKVLVDFLHSFTQINWLTRAIIARHILRRIYLNNNYTILHSLNTFNMVSKNAEFQAGLESLENIAKKVSQKRLKAETFPHSYKSKKLSFSITFFVETFFTLTFSSLFKRIRNQQNFCVFDQNCVLLTQLICSYYYFFEIWKQMHEVAQKTNKKLLYKCMFLEVKMCNHQRGRRLNLLKSIVPKWAMAMLWSLFSANAVGY